jgi:hypothetical protein
MEQMWMPGRFPGLKVGQICLSILTFWLFGDVDCESRYSTEYDYSWVIGGWLQLFSLYIFLLSQSGFTKNLICRTTADQACFCSFFSIATFALRKMLLLLSVICKGKIWPPRYYLYISATRHSLVFVQRVRRKSPHKHIQVGIKLVLNVIEQLLPLAYLIAFIWRLKYTGYSSFSLTVYWTISGSMTSFKYTHTQMFQSRFLSSVYTTESLHDEFFFLYSNASRPSQNNEVNRRFFCSIPGPSSHRRFSKHSRTCTRKKIDFEDIDEETPFVFHVTWPYSTHNTRSIDDFSLS